MQLVELSRIGLPMQTRPTYAGAHLTPTSLPQYVAMYIASINGKVYRGGKPGQVQVRILIAANRKRLMDLTAKPGSRTTNWDFGTLTNAGRIELNRILDHAASRAILAEALAKIGITL